MSPAEPLDGDALRTALGDQLIGRQIVVLQETTSTNDVVSQMAPQCEEGLVVFAERQSAGRGQHGKRWESSAQRGLWFSILLRPQIAARDSGRITTWAAQTIADTLRSEFGLPATVKPPNDVYCEGRKLAGVLLEMRAIPDTHHIGILGIGLNVNQRLEDFPEELRERASSLALLLDLELDRHQVAVAILRALDRTYPAAIRAGAS
ncbi:MAG: biotin--[acetyl-CoA-carboxylase] ligase [Chthoniobacterales bacterium]